MNQEKAISKHEGGCDTRTHRNVGAAAYSIAEVEDVLSPLRLYLHELRIGKSDTFGKRKGKTKS